MASDSSKYKILPGSRVSFRVKINPDDLKKTSKKIFSQIKSSVNVSGFRPGKAPKEKIIATYGFIKFQEEVFGNAVDQKAQDFLREHNFFALNFVDSKTIKDEKNKDITTIEIIVEIHPQIELGDISKIKTTPIKIPETTEKEVNNVLESFMAEHEIAKEIKAPAKDKNLVEVSFRAKDQKGEVIPRTEAEKINFRLGVGHYLEDLEKGIKGMKAGENKKVPVKFPEKYFNKELAGKTVDFEVEVFRVREINPEKVEIEEIQKIFPEISSVDDLRKDIKRTITHEKESREMKTKSKEYLESLRGISKGDIPLSWIEETKRNATEEQKKDPEALEKSIKVEILDEFVKSKLVKNLGLELEPEEEVFIQKKVEERKRSEQKFDPENYFAFMKIETLFLKHLGNIFLPKPKEEKSLPSKK